MQGLYLGGSEQVTLEQMRQTPTPQATKTHTPIPHWEMVDTVKKFARVEGLDIVEERYGIAPGRDKSTGTEMQAARMFGLMTLKAESGADHQISLGLRNAHDKAFAWGMTLGSRVMVCDNLCFSGDLTISRKHTGNIRQDIIPQILMGFERMPEIAAGQALRFERYKALEMDSTRANDFIVRAALAGVIAPNKIIAAVQEWEHPSHDAFEDRTLWSAFNGITEVMKGTDRNEGDTVRRGVGGVNIFDLPQAGRTLHTVADWYAREMLGDTLTPEPDAKMIEHLLNSDVRGMALAN